MTGAAGVAALVLAELVAGGLVLLLATPLWREVKPGFFTLTTSVLAVLAFGAWGSAAAARLPGDADGGRAVAALAATALTCACSAALFVARRRSAGRVVGGLAAAAGVASLLALAATGRATPAAAALELLAGAAFLGAVLDGLLLGHWYLTDRGLSRRPILRATGFLVAGVVAEAAAIALGGFGPTGAATEAFNPLLTSAGLAPWIALGMVATTGLVAVMVRLTLRGERASAVQAATGFFYLAVITALTADFAAKVRFLP